MNKKNLPLIIAIALPIMFVLILAISVTMSTSKVKPEYDFIYAFQQDTYGYKNSYITINGKVEYFQNANYNPKNDYAATIKNAPQLFYYNSDENSYREITLEEAKLHNLIPGQVSPDGYSVGKNRNYGVGDMFFGSSDYGYFIKKDDSSKRINISSENYYYEAPTILGWTK